MVKSIIINVCALSPYVTDTVNRDWWKWCWRFYLISASSVDLKTERFPLSESGYSATLSQMQLISPICYSSAPPCSTLSLNTWPEGGERKKVCVYLSETDGCKGAKTKGTGWARPQYWRGTKMTNRHKASAYSPSWDGHAHTQSWTHKEVGHNEKHTKTDKTHAHTNGKTHNDTRTEVYTNTHVMTITEKGHLIMITDSTAHIATVKHHTKHFCLEQHSHSYRNLDGLSCKPHFSKYKQNKIKAIKWNYDSYFWNLFLLIKLEV